MKKFFWRSILTCAVALWGTSFLHAQEEVPLIVSGSAQGTITAMKAHGTTYLDVQKTARKLGLGAALFAQSKQIKITAKNFYAILTAPLPEVFVNAKKVTLHHPVQISRGAVMAPVEFFELAVFQRAAGKEIVFKEGSLHVERPFDFERTGNMANAQENRLFFAARKKLSWTSQTPNRHTLEITFPGFTVKRDEHFRFKTDYISSLDIRQTARGAVLKVILGKKGKDWKIEQENNVLVFRVAATAPADPLILPAVPAAKKSAPSAEETASLPGDETVAATPADTPAGEEMTPSVLEENEAPSTVEETVSKDDFEEMKLDDTPTISAAEPVAMAAPKTTPPPVIKAAPPPIAIKPQRQKMCIVVDPGHGGKDPGAVRGRYREKDWNLAVSKELVKLLKKGGFDVHTTREDDKFVTLSGRSKMANEMKADLFVSIHTNATKSSSANGFQVYFRSEKATDKEAADIAAFENEAMQYEEVHYSFVDALLQSMAKNEYINESSKAAGYVRNEVYKQPGIGIAVNQKNSIRQADFYVLKGVNSPAILVEMGYISSPKDRARLSSSSGRANMAKGIYNGIVAYAKKEVKK